MVITGVATSSCSDFPKGKAGVAMSALRIAIPLRTSAIMTRAG
jgi:hypothetical protein